ncbi:hypothetical protein [Burkholderia gladioli]|uniref:hypothetical protein n=1 Tax=Burkholderia gladioli TaxID=28095 RepID=UPI00163E18E2|nr:hypothetical protein [Burkholderia gladioli]
MKSVLRALPSWILAIGLGSLVLLMGGLLDKADAARDVQLKQRAEQLATPKRPMLLRS